VSRRGREIETLLVTMYAAVPLYFTAAVGLVPLIAFHTVMLCILLRVAAGKGPELVPARLMRAIAFAYIPFYVIDAAILSRSAIAASTHLVLFIATYQPIESLTRRIHAQRLLTISLIFIASLATSTHIAIVLFVLVFAFLMFRQMMYVSHMETLRATGAAYQLAPSSRTATFYLFGTAIIGALLFPILPRVRNPVVQGFAGPLSQATTGLSDTIDFNTSRTSSPDPAVVARVWMGQEAIPFFTPLRLKGAVYDTYSNNRWLQTRDEFRSLGQRNGAYRIARPVGLTRSAIVQQRLIKGSRLFLPAGTYAVTGIPQLYEGPTRDTYMTFQGRGEVVTYEVSMARGIEPLRAKRVDLVDYPVSPAVATLAQQIAGGATQPRDRAEAVERYMLRNFQYLQRPEELGDRTMTVDEFLLRSRRGHCEYFAAGMVALMTALETPARVVGGFYGGRMNPLTGYFVVRREDAHAWVEVWDGNQWLTFDPTPPSLRPGNAQSGLLGSYVSALNDSVSYFWDRYILTFGLGDQITLAADIITWLRSTASLTKQSARNLVRVLVAPLTLIVIAAAALVGILIASGVLRRQSAFALLESHLRKLDIEVGPAMTIEEALVVLRRQHPEAAAQLEPLIALYEEEQFSTRASRERRRALRRRLAELRT
jgi:transglutaminase-like putative cysteine protease